MIKNNKINNKIWFFPKKTKKKFGFMPKNQKQNQVFCA